MMQLIVNIQNKSVADKVLAILNIFKDDGVKVEKVDTPKTDSKDAPEYDTEYERSFQYKLDRADFEEMKENL